MDAVDGSGRWSWSIVAVEVAIALVEEFLDFYWVPLPVWQSQSENRWDLLVFFFFLACREVSPITPLLSGVFVRRVFRAYFGRISGGSRKE